MPEGIHDVEATHGLRRVLPKDAWAFAALGQCATLAAISGDAFKKEHLIWTQPAGRRGLLSLLFRCDMASRGLEAPKLPRWDLGVDTVGVIARIMIVCSIVQVLPCQWQRIVICWPLIGTVAFIATIAPWWWGAGTRWARREWTLAWAWCRSIALLFSGFLLSLHIFRATNDVVIGYVFMSVSATIVAAFTLYGHVAAWLLIAIFIIEIGFLACGTMTGLFIALCSIIIFFTLAPCTV
jgi:hypothetical protein